MRIANGNKGFMLVLVLVFIGLFLAVAIPVLSHVGLVKDQMHLSEKKLQASNLAVEGMELAKGYVITMTNKDRAEWWRKYVVPLSGEYVFRYSGGYVAERGKSETIQMSDPYVVDYVRTVEISDDPDPSQKRISVTVDYGGRSKVQYSTTVTDLYGN